MIPPKTLEQMAEEYAIEATTPWHHSVSELTGLAARAFCQVSFEAGAKAALSLPEVRALYDAARFGLENTSSDFCAHFGDPDCGWCRPFNEALAAFDRLLEGVEK